MATEHFVEEIYDILSDSGQAGGRGDGFFELDDS